MPLYEYQCQDCGHKFEAMQKASDPPKKKCPKCGGCLRKIISASALQFKGRGWYITDYSRKAGGTKEAKESKEPGDKGAAEPQKKSEEKKSDPTPSSKKD
ncbi:MAG: hypothetical protein A2Y56_13135 [Candidatus Aminicenantes bacterium RBG_13_63_10]|nr:MAG: hypothetical protein A2Y56_13135 [Candidatus Aminicenantes bacterium RBG_13_63_10]